MSFGNVELNHAKEGEDKNAAELVVARGFASVVRHRSDEERSSVYETLLDLEEKAKQVRGCDGGGGDGRGLQCAAAAWMAAWPAGRQIQQMAAVGAPPATGIRDACPSGLCCMGAIYLLNRFVCTD